MSRRPGFHHTAETKAKMSAAARGDKNPAYGKTATPETRTKLSASRRADRNPRWNTTGTFVNADGYRHIRMGREWVLEHRQVMETLLGRPLSADEIVHHTNGDKLDNRPSNLEIMDRAEHKRRHPEIGENTRFL